MTPAIQITGDGLALFGTPLEGFFADFLNLAQPVPPVTVDWAEVPRLKVLERPLEAADSREFSAGVYIIDGGEKDLRGAEAILIEGKSTPVKIESVNITPGVGNGATYEVKGEILQPPKQQKPVAIPVTGTPTGYGINYGGTNIDFGIIGCTPLAGWQEALFYRYSYKRTPVEDSREITLPLLMSTPDWATLLTYRGLLEAMLFASSRCALNTPFGNVEFFFTRSSVTRYNLRTAPVVVYNLTITLL